MYEQSRHELRVPNDLPIVVFSTGLSPPMFGFSTDRSTEVRFLQFFFFHGQGFYLWRLFCEVWMSLLRICGISCFYLKIYFFKLSVIGKIF